MYLFQRHFLLTHIRRRGVVLNAHARACLVHQVDGLVRQIAVGNIALRQRDRRIQRFIGDVQLVMLFVSLAQAVQDSQRLLRRGFAHVDGLEAPLQRGILFDVLAVFIQRRRADALQFATCQGRLEDVGRIQRPFGRACADDGVHLVNEQQHVASLVDFRQHVFESLLEFTAVLAASHHAANVQRHHALAHQHIRHLALHNALRQSFNHGALAHTRFTNQHGIVLRATNQNLNQTRDFHIAPNHRIQLVILRAFGQVAAVLHQGRIVVLAARWRTKGNAVVHGAVVHRMRIHRALLRGCIARLLLRQIRGRQRAFTRGAIARLAQFFRQLVVGRLHVNTLFLQQLARIRLRILEQRQPKLRRVDIHVAQAVGFQQTVLNDAPHIRCHLRCAMTGMQADVALLLLHRRQQVIPRQLFRHTLWRLANLQQTKEQVQRAHASFTLPCGTHSGCFNGNLRTACELSKYRHVVFSSDSSGAPVTP